jgi:hypothetical protein
MEWRGSILAYWEKKSSFLAVFAWLTSQQYFSLTTNQPPATSQQYFSLRTNQHQPSQSNALSVGQADKSRRAEVQDQRDVPATNHLFYVAML